VWSSQWSENWQGQPKYSEITLSTTNTTWSEPGSNPGRRCGKPTTNRLSYNTAVKHLGMDIFLVSLCGTRAQICPHLSVILCVHCMGKIQSFFNVKAGGIYFSFCLVLGHYFSLPLTVLTLVGFSSLSLHWQPLVLVLAFLCTIRTLNTPERKLNCLLLAEWPNLLIPHSFIPGSSFTNILPESESTSVASSLRTGGGLKNRSA
jgi:hypothetical protein